MLKKISILTALGNDYGSGHYHKSILLRDSLKKEFPSKEQTISLYVLSKYPYKQTKTEKHIATIKDVLPLLIEDDISTLIIDKRETPVKIIKKIKNLGIKIIIIDSVGEERKFAHYAINPIPYLTPDNKSNLWDISFLPPIKTKRDATQEFQISFFFGFEDKQEILPLFLNQLETILKQLSLSKKIEHINLFIGEGNNLVYYNKVKKLCFKKLKNIPYTIYWKNEFFKEVVTNSALFFTYYGMSAIEAATVGTPVLLYNPSTYHNKLSTNFFPNQTLDAKLKHIPTYEELLSITKKTEKYLNNTLKVGKNFKKLKNIIFHINEKNNQLRQCVSCGFKEIVVVYRNMNENFYYCSNCELTYKQDILANKLVFQQPIIAYNKNYFLEEYKKSYKKTYEEDKNHLYEMAKKRLEVIHKYKKEGRLLDIGCALGYFLDVAKTMGYKTHGIEISDFAVSKIDKKHNVFCGSIYDFKKSKCFDVICLWYVIEHFKNHRDIFEKISNLQEKKGILALSTPNGLGLSARFNQTHFLATSPSDHYYIYNQTSLIALLKKYGYEHLYTKSTGIHTSRFKSIFPKLSKYVSNHFYHSVASQLGLGDTFEIYFIKK